MRRLKQFLQLLHRAFVKWQRDKAGRIASSLAFFSGLALAPLLLMAITVASFFYRGQAAQQILYAEVRDNIGEDAEELVRNAISGLVENQDEGIIATAIGFGVLFFSASNLFWQMQDAFNTIWRVPADKVSGVRNFLIGRMRALIAVLLVGFLLLAVVIISTTANSLQIALEDRMPIFAASFPLVNLAISLTLLTLIFSIVFHQMPQTEVAWRDVWVGAIVAAILFEIGETGLTYYFRTASVGSVYGAAGTLLVILVWVFYTMQIILLGAEISFVYAHEYGSRLLLIKEPGVIGERMPKRVEALRPQTLPAPRSITLSPRRIIIAVVVFAVGVLVGSRDGRG